MAPKLLRHLLTFHWPELDNKPYLAAKDAGKYDGWLDSCVLAKTGSTILPEKE